MGRRPLGRGPWQKTQVFWPGSTRWMFKSEKLEVFRMFFKEWKTSWDDIRMSSIECIKGIRIIKVLIFETFEIVWCDFFWFFHYCFSVFSPPPPTYSSRHHSFMSGENTDCIVIEPEEDIRDFCSRLNICLICFTRRVFACTLAQITCCKCKSTFCESYFLEKHSKIIDCHEFYC